MSEEALPKPEAHAEGAEGAEVSEGAVSFTDAEVFSGQAPADHAEANESSPDWPLHGESWQRVSPKYAWSDLVGNLIPLAIVVAVVFLLPDIASGEIPVFVWVLWGVVAALLLLNAVLAFRRVRAIGYILREDDLLFRRGIMFERVIAVPYGRLQLVDITRGPLLRALGLATLKFVTASAATGVNLPGLPVGDAERLRDRLVQLAETRRSGL